jgi:photosystem II stability/assembly factor-like uncharacterized protein
MINMRFGAYKVFLSALIFASLFFPHPLAAAKFDGSFELTASQFLMDWRATGPSGGDVRALVVDPKNHDRFYFGTLDGQLYVSNDAGQTWSVLYNFNRPELFVDNIVVDSRDSNVLYVATHKFKSPGGFYKSTDGGKTWRQAVELKDEALHSLVQSSENPDVLVVGSITGVFRSDDSGETWKKLNNSGADGLRNVESLAIDPRDSNILYVGTWYLPYKSSDGGKTWSSIKTGMIDDSDVFAIDIDPRDPNHIIASACSGIYDSRNGGGNWRKVQGIPSQSRRTRAILQHPSTAGLVFAGTTEGFWRSEKGGADGSWMLTTSKQLEINSIAVHPDNPMTVFIGTNNYGVMISRDAGKTFVPSNGGYSGRFANHIMSDREKPGRVYATTINTATGGGFFFTSDDGGGTWQPSMRNMPYRLVGHSMLQDERDPNIIYLGTNLGIYRSMDRGASWAPLNAPKPEPKPSRKKRRSKSAPSQPGASSSVTSVSQDRAVVKPSPKPNPIVKNAQQALKAAGFDAGIPDGYVGKKTTVALRGFQAQRGLPQTGKIDSLTLTALGVSTTAIDGTAGDTGPVFITDIVHFLIPTNDERNGEPGIFAATNVGLFRTYDPEIGWERISFGSAFNGNVTAISTSKIHPETIWVGTANSGMLVSRDRGVTWQTVEGVPTDAPIAVIKQDPQRAENVYVGTKRTFYYSHDDGKTWTRRGGILPYGEYTAIAVNPRNGLEIFVGNSFENAGGVYRSIDGGDTWVRVDPRNKNLPSQRIWALEFDSSTGSRLFVGSHSAGVYVADRGGDATAIGGK